MFNPKTLTFAAVAALAPVAGTAATVTIDSFDTFQEVVDPTDGIAPASSTAPAAEAVGGERTLTASGNGNGSRTGNTAITVDSGSASVANGPNVTGTGLFAWSDTSGVDLTDGGLNDTFVLGVDFIDIDVVFALTIDGSTSTSMSTSTTGDVTFSFDDFDNLSAAENISLLVSGPVSFDATFNFLGAEDLQPNPSAVPLPAGGLLLGSLLLGGAFASRRKNKA